MRALELSFVVGVIAAVASSACAGSKAGSGTPDATPDPAMISISPTTPHAGDDLHAQVANPGAATYSFRWSVDGTVRADLTGLNVAASNTHRAQTWSVDLLDAGGAMVSTASVTILDTAPGAPTVVVTALPCNGEAIQCSIGTPAPDVDGDVISYTATWTKNGAPMDGAIQTVFPGDTVPASATATIGDSFVCIVTATDGEMTSTAMSAPTAVVSSGPVTFGFANGSQTYAVPDCVKHVTIAAWGAQGGGTNGGAGGYAQGNVDVTGGMMLDVEVGGQNGYNGGGAGVAVASAPNGGGASDVRVGGNALLNRVIVAGGGGGGGNGDAPGNYLGGTGGGGTCGTGYCGGGGGAGYSYPSAGAGQPGAEGGGAAITQEHAGGGGGGGHSSGGGPSCETYDAPSRCASPGSLGQGGAADPGGQTLHGGYCFTANTRGTAGGGGGYYGGGGTSVGWCGGGAGGGGSSWVGSLTAATMTGGVRAGDGQIVITPY